MLLYPERKRCRRCRRYLTLTIIDGLYCSMECALQTPDDEADCLIVPRECRVAKRRKGGPKRWYFKRRYHSLYQLIGEALPNAGESIYRCGYCGFLHMGRRRVGDEPN